MKEAPRDQAPSLADGVVIALWLIFKGARGNFH
jgi:hypothetical protein